MLEKPFVQLGSSGRLCVLLKSPDDTVEQTIHHIVKQRLRVFNNKFSDSLKDGLISIAMIHSEVVSKYFILKEPEVKKALFVCYVPLKGNRTAVIQRSNDTKMTSEEFELEMALFVKRINFEVVGKSGNVLGNA